MSPEHANLIEAAQLKNWYHTLIVLIDFLEGLHGCLDLDILIDHVDFFNKDIHESVFNFSVIIAVLDKLKEMPQ